MRNIARALTMVVLTTAALSACLVAGDLPDEDLAENEQALASDPPLKQELEPAEGASDEGLIPVDGDAALLAPCGESLRICNTNQTCVDYRHCTSGSDSLRVRAIIHLGPDGPCTTVGPNQTRLIWVYGGISFFDRIARC